MPKKATSQEPIPFGRAYAQSEVFRTMFQEGMTLVEETASYLDGDGRRVAKSLGRPASVIYATESMRLTSRLMQLASWLLLQRSVNEGDVTPADAEKEKRKIRLERFSSDMGGPGWEGLPLDFVALVRRSMLLQKRIEKIDAAMAGSGSEAAGRDNPVALQIDALASALAKRG